MISIHPQYITDSKGKRRAVIISIKEFSAIMEQLEELQDIMLYDEAKRNNEESVSIDKAFKTIEKKRRRLW
jgi:PHD/YefM family antitoxin component YafN of YafNO toxin-antitoxin module